MSSHPSEKFDLQWFIERGLHVPGKHYMVGARPGMWRGPWPDLVIPMVLAADYAALRSEVDSLQDQAWKHHIVEGYYQKRSVRLFIALERIANYDEGESGYHAAPAMREIAKEAIRNDQSFLDYSKTTNPAEAGLEVPHGEA